MWSDNLYGYRFGFCFLLQVNIAGPHPPFSITSNMSETVRGRTFPLAVDHTTLTKEQQQIVRQGNITTFTE